VAGARARVVSSFTIIKGALIEETYAAFASWDLSATREENLRRLKGQHAIGPRSQHWARDVGKVLHRRFDPSGPDRPLVELAQAGCDREVWKPVLLWHMTRDEFLVRDFLIRWLYPQYVDGAYRLRADDVVPYLAGLAKRKAVRWAGKWSETTTDRVATGLLRMAADFGLLRGTTSKQFASYHLPEQSFLYLLHAMADAHPSGRRVVELEDWRMFLLGTGDVEREILRLHQYRKLHYDVAGSIAELRLSHGSAAEYAKELTT
jgi:hypothetical protein